MVSRKPNIEPHELLEETHRADTTTNGFKNRAKKIANSDEVTDKIHKTLKLLILRDESYLIQFWSPSSDGKYNLLKTVNQPFRIGMHNQGLCRYRSESERKWFLVDEECNKEDLIPIVRVFRRQVPEWTSDVINYHSKKHPLQDCAILGNLHGYLVLPVFDSVTMLCVGVLEIITSTKYIDCSYEVQEVHRALKESNLTSPRAFDFPTSYVDNENRQHVLHEIFKVLKDVCDTHKLPLAQTWTTSSRSSFVTTERNTEMTCSSFKARCIGKVCMSTAGLPFYVRDLSCWQFREACREHHLLESEGVVGRALSSNGSCFCPDVTKLREDEYSLVHNARMSKLTSCYAIYLDSSEHVDGYIIEFFLPVNMRENSDLHNLVQMIKMQFKLSSIEYRDILITNVIGISMEASQLSLTMQESVSSQWASSKATTQRVSSISEASMNLGSSSRGISLENSGETQIRHETNSQDQPDFSNAYPENQSNVIMKTERMREDDATRKKLDVVTGEKRTCIGRMRKRKRDSITLETIQKHFGKPIGEASRRLDVSRSTLKRVCRELKITSWPMPHCNKKHAHFDISVVALLLVRVKRWICLSNHHGFSGMWWICGKHNAFVSKENPSASYLPKGETICVSSQLTKESDEAIETTTPFSEPSQAHYFSVYQASSKNKREVNVSDTSMVTVKATFKNDIVKFQIPLSSGLLELKNQVAQRIKLKSTRLRLKYKDEDGDLILISCDADLMPFSASAVSKNTIKLIVHMVDE